MTNTELMNAFSDEQKIHRLFIDRHECGLYCQDGYHAYAMLAHNTLNDDGILQCIQKIVNKIKINVDIRILRRGDFPAEYILHKSSGGWFTDIAGEIKWKQLNDTDKAIFSEPFIALIRIEKADNNATS